jgi:signal transduction histidine kinase
MAFKLNWQRRSVVILAVVTFILGFILTMLAIREVEREKLAREKDLNREQQRYAALLSGEIDSLFSEIEKRITASIVDFQKQQDIRNLSEFCRRVAENEDLIGDIFLAGANNELVFPLKNPLFFALERRRIAGLNLAKIEGTGLFKEAESAELASKNLPLAIQSYKTLLDSVPDDSSRALVLNRLARCYLKSGNLSQALRTYNTILDNHPSELSSDGVFLGIIAFYQMAGIIQRTEPEKAGLIVLEFYGCLADAAWPLDRSQFQFYQSMIRKMVELWATEGRDTGRDPYFGNRWDELEKLADTKLKHLTAEEDLAQKIIPLIHARMFEPNRKYEEFSRFSEIAGDTLFLISAASLSERTILGIRVDNSVLMHDRLPAILDRIPIPEDWIVQIADSSGRVIGGEENLDSAPVDIRAPFVAVFDQNFPPWQIHIAHRYPGSVDRQFNLRRNVYILIAVAMVAILFVGGLMVIRSTAKELELARLKSEFVSTVSHEFRTPLMSIRYLSEMLDAGRVKGVDKKKIYYGKINKESERLSRLIENMLDFSKIETGIKKYKFEDLSVKDLVKEVSDRFREYTLDKKTTLECEIPDRLPFIHADREAISRALFNLLDNAAKYSGKNPVIQLRAGLEDDTVFLEVQDTGAGIGKDEQKKVFEKFYRSSDPANKNIEGSGIGLTLVDHIVKAHGGEVKMESELEKGTRVTIQLPISGKGKKDD